jgi:predicted translin family RNA/ssDNA-binding protein
MITMFVLGIMALFGGFFLEYQRGVADPVGAEIMRRILQFFGYDSFPVAARLSFFLAAICHLYCILMSPAHLTLKKKLGR